MHFCGCLCPMISIHALREEGDPASVDFAVAVFLFLSTPSARRATATMSINLSHRSISIHALREEGDMPGTRSIRRMRNFYPRPPRGGRLTELLRKTVNTLISIHALREEGDAVRQCSRVSLRIFLSTPSARRATHGASA